MDALSRSSIPKVLIACALSASMLIPSAAWAQQDSPAYRGDNPMWLTTAFFFGGLGLGVTTGAGVGYLSGWGAGSTQKKLDEKAELERRQRLLRSYVVEHEAALPEVVALGAGGLLLDLAKICHIPSTQLTGFAHALRRKRASLRVDGDLDLLWRSWCQVERRDA